MLRRDRLINQLISDQSFVVGLGVRLWNRTTSPAVFASCFLQTSMPKTILIPIPISKSSAPRFRNSVEGLNQEIERIIIRDTPEKEETIVVSFYDLSVFLHSTSCPDLNLCSNSHRTSPTATARPRPTPHSAAAALAASTPRLPQAAD